MSYFLCMAYFFNSESDCWTIVAVAKLNNRTSNCWINAPVTVEQSSHSDCWTIISFPLLNNRANDYRIIVSMTIEQSIQWLLNNCVNDYWTIVSIIFCRIIVPKAIEQLSHCWKIVLAPLLNNRASNCWVTEAIQLFNNHAGDCWKIVLIVKSLKKKVFVIYYIVLRVLINSNCFIIYQTLLLQL